MKKTLLFLPAILLLAAGCNGATSTTPPSAKTTGYQALPPATSKPTTVNPTPPTSATKPGTTMQHQAIPQPTANFTVSADDNTAIPTSISATRGQMVSVTFKVSSQNVYHAGLDFRSPVISTGTISSGQSKTISFTADQSFDFTPYWPASNTKKSYTIHVVVK